MFIVIKTGSNPHHATQIRSLNSSTNKHLALYTEINLLELSTGSIL